MRRRQRRAPLCSGIQRVCPHPTRPHLPVPWCPAVTPLTPPKTVIPAPSSKAVELGIPSVSATSVPARTTRTTPASSGTIRRPRIRGRARAGYQKSPETTSSSCKVDSAIEGSASRGWPSIPTPYHERSWEQNGPVRSISALDGSDRSSKPGVNAYATPGSRIRFEQPAWAQPPMVFAICVRLEAICSA